MMGLWRLPESLAAWRALLGGIRGAAEGGDEAQVSQVKEVGAAQDDLRAGSDFAIPEATSAGW
jgi:hypothetical protein